MPVLGAVTSYDDQRAGLGQDFEHEVARVVELLGTEVVVLACYPSPPSTSPLGPVVTRVPVQTLIDYLEAGDPLDEFLADFPSVRREQAVATWSRWIGA